MKGQDTLTASDNEKKLFVALTNAYTYTDTLLMIRTERLIKAETRVKELEDIVRQSKTQMEMDGKLVSLLESQLSEAIDEADAAKKEALKMERKAKRRGKIGFGLGLGLGLAIPILVNLL